MRQTTTFLSKVFLFGMAASMLAACSIYESSDRKQLEQNGYALAGIQLMGCEANPGADTERLYADSSQAWIFQNVVQPLNIRVELKATPGFSCRFTADSETQLKTSLDKVVETTTEESRKN